MIYDVFHMLLLEQNMTRKGRVDNKITKLDDVDNKGAEYKIKAIWDSTVYAKESTSYLLGLYYLVS